MTFSRSLYMSMVLHVLVFGGTLALAQFAGGALWGHRDVLMVSLVGPGAGPAGKASQREDCSETEVRRRQEANRTTPASAKPEFPAHRQDMRNEDSPPGMLENTRGATTDAGEEETGKEQKGADADGSGPGSQFGPVSADQWAVIQAALERSKTYPRVARERGIQGVVHVRFRITPSGEVETVEIVKSSGYDILDSATVRTVYRAAPMPSVRGWVEIPISYVLK